MKKNKKLLISITLITVSLCFIFFDNKLLAQHTISSKLKGKILLQVEDNGEAWYIYPYDLKKYYLGKPKDAFDMMRNLGIGISNNDIKQIPIAEANFIGKDDDSDGLSNEIEDSIGTDKNNTDSDNDGYSDKTEILNNHNPLNNESLIVNTELQKKLSGLILMQIEQNGEAWYVNPDDLKRYYLGKPLDAFNLMKKLGLGITNKNIAKIEEYKINEKYTTKNIVKKFTNLINNSNSIREYTDSDYNFKFNYPNNWKIKKYENQPYITQITDSDRDYILEKKGVISLNYFKTSNNIGTNINTFRVATKGKSTVLSDGKKNINNKEAYENSYEHLLAYEKTTTIQIDSDEFIQITLVTAKHNNDYYINIYNNLLKSIQFTSQQ